MTKNVGILTQPLQSNYGGILQAWALQKFLAKQGYHAITIDIAHFKQKSFAKKGIHTIKTFIQRNLLHKKRNYNYFSKMAPLVDNSFKEFCANNMTLTDRITSKEELYKYIQSSSLDALIVGSDQVWRPRYSPYLPIYFFENVPSHIKKIAYAASFGVDTWEYTPEETKRYAALAQNIDAISVREDSAVELCEKHLACSAQHVVDPTLLIPKEAYTALIEDKNKKANRTCFSYILDENKDKEHIIEEVCRTKGLQRASLTTQVEESPYGKIYQKPTISCWLAHFHQADFIVTDSFHGCVFSIIFNKPFYPILNPKRGNSRFYSLFKLFGLEDRLSIENIDEPIDWESVNSKRSQLVEMAQYFINNQLEA